MFHWPSATADASEGHLKFDSSVIGIGDNLVLAMCNYALGGISTIYCPADTVLAEVLFQNRG